MGNRDTTGRRARPSLHHQCMYPHISRLFRQRLPLCFITLPLCAGAERSSTTHNAQLYQSVCIPTSSLHSLTDDSSGVPYFCILASVIISLLSYLCCASGSAQVFVWFQNIVAISSLIVWTSLLCAYLKFFYALRAQGVSRDTLPFKSPFQPYTAWASLIYFGVIIFFNGFWTFPSPTKPFSFSDFATAYIGLPIFGCLYIFWKLVKRTRMVGLMEVDLKTGKAAIDARDHQEAMAKAARPQRKNAVHKFWARVV